MFVIEKNEPPNELFTFIYKNLHYEIKSQGDEFSRSIAYRYTDVIDDLSKRYALDSMLLARQACLESRFMWWAIGQHGEIGPMQVMLNYWGHLIYRLDGGYVGIKLLRSTNQQQDARRYAMRIGYGMELGCMIMSNLMSVSPNYESALVAYNRGTQAALYKQAIKNPLITKKDPYVSYIVYRND